MAPILTRLDVRGTTRDLREVLPAPEAGLRGIAESTEVVRDILGQVRSRGDQAVRELTKRLDGVEIEALRVPPATVMAAVDQIGDDLRAALEVAAANIEAYHRGQIHVRPTTRRQGVTIEELRLPVERAGLYVPGGRAPLASTVLMTAVVARVAGVAQIALSSPPGPDGCLAPAILAAAAIAGVDEVYRIGGAQAIAAMAYGTESVAPVDVIAGPGNRYVAIAERLVAQEGAVGVPSAFTGPSEVVVVADETTPVEYAAIDLVVQAEHGPDGLAWLVTWSEEAAEQISEAVGALAGASPRRDEILSTLAAGGYAVLVDGPEQAMAVANVVAAEHLELMTADAAALVPLVRNAGAVFVGPWSPASVGDYVAGPSHVLPTARSARFGSALGVDDFCKRTQVITLDSSGLARLAPHVAAMAGCEGMGAHGESVRMRVATP